MKGQEYTLHETKGLAIEEREDSAGLRQQLARLNDAVAR
jgi:hypothetical protein